MKRSDFLLLNLTPRRYGGVFGGKSAKAAAITLAVECLEEAQTVDEIWRKRVERVVACEVDDADRQKVYGEALLRLRLRRMVPLDPRSGIDTKLVTQAEYQVFLDEVAHNRRQLEIKAICTWSRSHPRVRCSAEDAEAFLQLAGKKKQRMAISPSFLSELTTLQTGTTGDQIALETFGCWAKGEAEGSPTIACLSESVRQRFLSQSKELFRELIGETYLLPCLCKEVGLRPVSQKTLNLALSCRTLSG